MNKLTFVISSPFDCYSGYSARSRDIIKSIIDLDKYNVKLLSQRWGNTPWGFCKSNKEWEFLLDYQLPQNQLTEKPDIWFQITIPSEFQAIGKYNIGCTAGIECTVCAGDWIEGLNRMDLNITSSEFSKKVFKTNKFKKVDKTSNRYLGELKLETPIEVLFEGISPTEFSPKIKSNLDLSQIKEDFVFIFVGTWIGGNNIPIGQDRKNIPFLIKAFFETFKNKRNQPALILKTSTGNSSYLSRNEILKRIKKIKDTVKSNNLPNIYLLNGDITDKRMVELYNHPKVKAMISLTKGEGFGRPLLEFSFMNKPIITTNFSGQQDFLNPQYTNMLGGTLEKVHPEASNKWLLQEGEWFKVNEIEVGKTLTDVYKNYKKHLENAKRQGYENRNKFSINKMKEKLNKILSDNIPDLPVKVDLQLPELELPTIKK